ncbi:hypothetical protein ACQPZF_13525 [Actinosynnema sp. CS-041913]|uniref:hypothetical protein n=1 Tax=Actinosynnema sp. CS-041913 TaxID=3239917 RepID=UPI003D8B5F40
MHSNEINGDAIGPVVQAGAVSRFDPRTRRRGPPSRQAPSCAWHALGQKVSFQESM